MNAPPIIPSDAPSIYDQLSTLDKQAIVRPNNPPRGIAGFLFDYDAEQFMELVAEVTDHFIEDNTTLQDNIALLPERITVRGSVAELTDSADIDDTPAPQPAPLPLVPALFPPFAPAANISFSPKLGALGLNAGVSVDSNGITVSASITGAIGPFSSDSIIRTVTGELSKVISVSSPALAAINAAISNTVISLSGGTAPSTDAIASAIINAVGNIIGNALTPAVSQLITQSVNSSVSTTSGTNPGPAAGASSSLYQYYLNRSQIQPGLTQQALAMNYFYQMFLARQLFSVETPWGIMNNMTILSIRPEQPEETKYMTGFVAVFKKIRIARPATVNLGQLAGRNAFQASSDAPAQNGTAGQTPVAPAQQESILAKLMGGGTP